MRVVWLLGAVPASARPSRAFSTGEATTSRMTTATGRTILAWPVTNRPQRATGVFGCPSRESSVGCIPSRPRSILWPSSDSTAGSSDWARSTAVSTPSALPMPSLVMKSMPMRARPVIEIATVVAGEEHGPAGGRAGGRGRVLRRRARRAGYWRNRVTMNSV